MEETDRISVRALPEYITAKGSQITGSIIPPSFPAQSSHSSELSGNRRTYEKQLLSELLQKHGRSGQGKEMAAREMGVSLRTFYRKLKDHAL